MNRICNKNFQQCSKEKGHGGRCNKERKLTFWKASSIQKEPSLKQSKNDNAGKFVCLFINITYYSEHAKVWCVRWALYFSETEVSGLQKLKFNTGRHKNVWWG